MKPKRIKKFQNLEGDLKKLFSQTYKDGFDGYVIDFTDPRDQQTYKAVPLETEEFYYLVNIEAILKSSSFSEIEDDESGDLVESVEFESDEVEGMSDDEEEFDDEEPAEAEAEADEDDDD